MDETLETFHIKRSLSMKGCFYDNAVAEATFKIIKTEFVNGHSFQTLDDLQYQLADYVNWFNNHRIHSSLGYLTPYQFKFNALNFFFVLFSVDNPYFSRAVSSEYAYLALPKTVPLFIQKVQRKALKQYRKRERVSKGYGDIVICIDESSSMRGDAIAWAKAVALVLMEYVIQNDRSCAIVRFSSKGNIGTHIFQKSNYTTENVLVFAESFLGGGTDFEEPLIKGIELIEDNRFHNADIVFLTDG